MCVYTYLGVLRVNLIQGSVCSFVPFHVLQHLSGPRDVLLFGTWWKSLGAEIVCHGFLGWH